MKSKIFEEKNLRKGVMKCLALFLRLITFE